jgi:hypothetical protein
MDVFSQSDWGALWVYASAGGMMAQGGILSVVAVFLRASFWLRMGAFCAATLLAWMFWALGMLFNSHILNGYSTASYLDELRLGVFGLPLLAVAIQMPLWTIRLYRGWELRHSQLRQPAQPLRILDYLLCMGAVAVAIASARWAVKPAEMNTDYWTGFGIACAVAAGISLVSVPPALWLLFRWTNAWLGYAALIVYSATATALTLAVLEYINTVIWQRSSGIRPWGAIGIGTVFVSFGGFLGGALFLLRATGFFLVTRCEQAHA